MTTNGTDQGEWYTANCGATQFTLPVRYQQLAFLGEGCVGAVARATDKQTNKYVAIKKITHLFLTPTHAKRIYRELKLLMHFNHPDAQVAQLYNVFTPEKSLSDFQTLYFVLKHVDYNLNQVIIRNLPFTEDHIKFFIYSLLRGLKFIHSAGIVHSNLSPSNIGIDKTSNITLFDFGSARDTLDEQEIARYVNRWWRAPEVMLCAEQHGDKLDAWSIGCIMAELILLRPLFPGRHYIDQLEKIFDIIGTPDLAVSNNRCMPAVVDYVRRLPSKPRQDYNELFGFKYDARTQSPTSGVSPEGIDLLDNLLTFDHRTRPTAEEAVAHPFFEMIHDPMEEPTKECIVDEHRGEDYSVEEWKSIIWQTVKDFVPPSWINDDDEDDVVDNQ